MSGFSEVLDALRTSGDNTVEVTEDWAQGRALFGGLAAAITMEPVMRQVAPERELRSVSIAFVGPVAPGDVHVAPRALREGGSVSQFQAEALQDGQVKTSVLASFGKARPSGVAMPAEPVPAAPAPEEVEPVIYREGVNPAFTRHFEYRYCIGSLPFTGATTRDMGGWIRFRDEGSPMGPLQLLGLIDAWPPATLPLLTERAPSSSLTWFVELVQPLPAIGANDWLLYQATLDHARDGYGQTQARLWTRTGELVALSRQTVAVFG